MSVYTDRGVYIVAYGGHAHDCAYHLIRTIHKYSPGYPVCLACEGFAGEYKPPVANLPDDKSEPFTDKGSCEELPETFRDVLIDGDRVVTDRMSDRRARDQKTRIWDLAPADWRYVLYLDADILVSCNLDLFFQPLEDGWDMVLTLSPPRGPLVRHGQRAKYKLENVATEQLIHGNHWLQPAGGVWSFARNERTERFLKLFHEEWRRYQQTDQQAMIRALYQAPVRGWYLGTEWNTFMHHPDEAGRSAGIRHFATAARAWTIQHDGRALWLKWSERL